MLLPEQTPLNGSAHRWAGEKPLGICICSLVNGDGFDAALGSSAASGVQEIQGCAGKLAGVGTVPEEKRSG